MEYIIDSANWEEIQEAFQMGISSITANPSMYVKNKISLESFLKKALTLEPSFLTAEVIGDTMEEMVAQAEELMQLHSDLVIKINFSEEGLKTAHALHQKGISTAMTLIFSVNAAAAAIQAGCDYLFPFIGRNDEGGFDGMKLVHDVQEMVKKSAPNVVVVAASIKNIHQLEELNRMGIDAAGLPYHLYLKSLTHPLLEQNREGFTLDWQELQNRE